MSEINTFYIITGIHVLMAKKQSDIKSVFYKFFRAL